MSSSNSNNQIRHKAIISIDDIDEDDKVKGPISLSSSESDLSDIDDKILYSYNNSNSNSNSNNNSSYNSTYNSNNEDNYEQFSTNKRVLRSNTKLNDNDNINKKVDNNVTSKPSRREIVLDNLLNEKIENDKIKAGVNGQNEAYQRFLLRESMINNANKDSSDDEESNEEYYSTDDEFILSDDENDNNENIAINNDNVKNNPCKDKLASVLDNDRQNSLKSNKNYKVSYRFFNISNYKSLNSNYMINLSIESLLNSENLTEIQKKILINYNNVRNANDQDKELKIIKYEFRLMLKKYKTRNSDQFVSLLFSLMIAHDNNQIKDECLKLLKFYITEQSLYKRPLPFTLTDLLGPLAFMGINYQTQNLILGEKYQNHIDSEELNEPKENNKNTLIYQTSIRINVLIRLIDLLTFITKLSYFEIQDLSSLVLTMLLLNMDKSMMSLNTSIQECLRSSLESTISNNEEPLRDLSILSKILPSTFDKSLPFKVELLLTLPVGPIRLIRMRRWLAYVILLEGRIDKIDEISYLNPPNLIPLINELKNNYTDGIFTINDYSNYDNLFHNIEILSLVLTDIESYLQADKELIKYNRRNDDDVSEDCINVIINCLRKMFGRINDTRCADLNRSKAKDSIQRLEMRLYWQRSTFILKT